MWVTLGKWIAMVLTRAAAEQLAEALARHAREAGPTDATDD